MVQDHQNQNDKTARELAVAKVKKKPTVWAWLCIGLALCLHLFAVMTIVRQPLMVQYAPADQQSVIWSLHNDTVHRKGPAADFFAVYHAGHNLKQGHSPYSFKENPRKTPYLFGFRYLPVVGQTVGWVASYFEPLHAWRGWVLATELVLLLFIFVFRRRTAPGWLRCLGTCLALVSSPYLLELHMGQFTFVTIALVLVGVMLYGDPNQPTSRGKGAVAALSFTAAVLLKLFPLAAVPALVRDKRFWLPVAIALGVTVAVSLAFFVPNPVEWGHFVTKNFSKPTGGMHSGNYGFIYWVFLAGKVLGADWVDATPPWLDVASVVRNAVLGLSMGLVLLTRSRQMSVMVCLMLMAHFVSYVHVWEHHMSGVVLIGLVVLASLYEAEEDVPRGLLVLVLVATVALVLPTPFALLDTVKNPREHYPSTTWSFAAKSALVLSKGLPTLMLYGACVWIVGRAGLRLPRFSKPTETAL